MRIKIKDKVQWDLWINEPSQAQTATIKGVELNGLRVSYTGQEEDTYSQEEYFFF